LVAGIWHDQWIYLTAPFVGAVLAVIIYKMMGEPA
jgi:glycerol uptake facilitator-like aquaporin